MTSFHCFGCDAKTDATAVIWVYDSPYCVSCYMDFADHEEAKPDEAIAKTDEPTRVIGAAR